MRKVIRLSIKLITSDIKDGLCITVIIRIQTFYSYIIQIFHKSHNFITSDVALIHIVLMLNENIYSIEYSKVHAGILFEET